MFPYIKQIKVNDCYAYQNFSIPHEPLDTYRHIILTGKNGSGKTTILNRVAFLLEQAGKFGAHGNRPEICQRFSSCSSKI